MTWGELGRPEATCSAPFGEQESHFTMLFELDSHLTCCWLRGDAFQPVG